MQEDFLHHLWQYQKIDSANLKTVSGNNLQVLKVGQQNQYAGPDFFNAQIIIGNQKWAGNIEIHLKSSDWYAHNHQQDKNYDTIILHVVWEDDVVVFDKNNNPIETLVLKNITQKFVFQNYQKLIQNKNWIPCENEIHGINNFTWSFWKTQLIINRLTRKTKVFEAILEKTNHNWEALLFELLAKNFGLKMNQQAFLSVAQNISFLVFKKEIPKKLTLEALLLGQANLLKDTLEDGYYQQLQQEFQYLKHKHQLKTSLVKMNFYGIRPAGFPTIRLSQFASLYSQNSTLFAKIIKIKTIEDAQKIFLVSASEYWNTHYTFCKKSGRQTKKITNSFIALLLINVVIPLKYLYAKSLGEDNIQDVLALYSSLPSEKNGIINKFVALKIEVKTALDSQSLIELKN